MSNLLDDSQAKEAPEAKSQKRKASAADVDGAPPRPVKRRASKACQCCRARKVRCNVTEHGAPCTNCRLDEVECKVSESRRKKKYNKDVDGQANAQSVQPESTSEAAKSTGRKIVSRNAMPIHPDLIQRPHNAESPLDSHVPHSICMSSEVDRNCRLTGCLDQSRLGLNLQSVANHGPCGSPTPSAFPHLQQSPMTSEYFLSGSKISSIANFPYYIKPLPEKIGPDEFSYLEKKGALTVPTGPLRNELIRAYIEFVHPYMPLIDLYEFVMIVESGNGALGHISLILYQAIMFAGSAFVDMQYLFNAGYTSRKQARKDFFQKTRLLYDFDYESDRVSLVQALLLLTYYYETPDDQKDTWHWMGVATSVAHTIGLHRNPERSNMDVKRTKLWKRIWWSTYMRDRLIALGMRRPTRIKAEDYDVPMITLDDFEFVTIPESVTCVPADCSIARDVDKQRELAIMYIEKAKLCLCISHVLSKQYCVLNNNQGMVNDRTTMMLLPKKLDPETSELKICDQELQQWLDNLPNEARMTDSFTGNASIDLNRCLLHLVFFTTLSALHRPQVLPSTPTTGPQTQAALELLESSRLNVRRAANAITSIAQTLDNAGLVKYLPTTGVTVLLPAIIIHLLDIKSLEEDTRLNSLRGFYQCMTVMNKLRDVYAAADYSTAFLEAAIRKAGIQVSTLASPSSSNSQPVKMHPVTTVEDLIDAGRRIDILGSSKHDHTSVSVHVLTPPPENTRVVAGFASDLLDTTHVTTVTDEEVARRLGSYLASTPPDSDDHQSDSQTLHFDTASLAATGTTLHGHYGYSAREMDLKIYTTSMMPEFGTVTDEDDFDALVDLDAIEDRGVDWSFDDGGIHGFTVDMDWLGATVIAE